MARQRPYSPWRRAGDFVIISGQLGACPGATTLTSPRRRRRAAAPGARERGDASSTRPGRRSATSSRRTMFVHGHGRLRRVQRGVARGVQRSAADAQRSRALRELPYGALAEVELWAYSPER